MRDKLTSEIIKLNLNDASYKGCGVSIVPTYVNFFFGNNGTGKSTIGKAIKVDNGVEWRHGRSVSDYKIHVYNQDYINANLHSYHMFAYIIRMEKINNRDLIKRIIVIIIGSVISAYGITRAIYSGFGGATLAILWQGVSNIIHVSVGVSSLIVAAVMIAFSFFMTAVKYISER